MNVRLRLNNQALDYVLNNPAGPVGKHLGVIGLRIKDGAAIIAGRNTGELVRKLYIKQGRRGRIQYVEVGSKAKHAFLHHEGTKPHLMSADSGRIMRLNVSGRAVYVRKVNHPGTPANRYLTLPMRRALR